MIFVDTAAFIAWFCPNDQNHEAAVRTWAALIDESAKLVTSNFIMDETITLLWRRTSNLYAADRAEHLYSSSILHINRVDESHENSGLIYFRKFADQNISFTDCISFVIMEQLSITQAFTFDNHFRIAGFEILGDS